MLLQYFKLNETDINISGLLEHAFCRIWDVMHLSIISWVTQNNSVIL